MNSSTAAGRLLQVAWLLLFIAACFGVIYLTPLSGIFNISYDWPKEWLSYRLLMKSVRVHGEFPWFSYGMHPYYLPCYFTLFNPENGYLSLFTPILLGLNHFFLAIWISFGIHLAIGGFGFYHLMTRLGCSPLPTLLFLTAFLFGSWPLAHFSAGHLTWQTWYLFPLCFDFLHRGMEACRKGQPYLRFLVITGLIHAFMLYEGGQHIWLMSGLALGSFALLGLSLNPGPRMAAGFAALQATAMAAFAAPKLFPLLMLFPSYTSTHDYPLEGSELFDTFLNLSFENWEKDFFIGYPVVAVMLLVALLWPLRGRWAARPEAPKSLIVEDRRAMGLLIVLFVLFAFWPWRECFDALPALRTQGVRARFLSLSIFFALILCGLNITFLFRHSANSRAQRIGFHLVVVVLIGLNVWSLREKVSQTHAKAWVPIEEFKPVDNPMGEPMVRAWDGRGSPVPAKVRMKGSVDFEVVWPGGPPGEEAVVVLPRLAHELYQKTFSSPGARVVDRNGRVAFTNLQAQNGLIPFHYTLYHEKIGLLAFLILAGLLPVLYRLLAMSGKAEPNAKE